MLNKISDNIYEVPMGYKPNMRVAGRIFVSPLLMEMIEPGTVRSGGQCSNPLGNCQVFHGHA